MIKLEKILNMSNEEILANLTGEELELVDNTFANRNNFCDIYQDSAKQSGEDEHFNPSEFLEIYLENR